MAGNFRLQTSNFRLLAGCLILAAGIAALLWPSRDRRAQIDLPRLTWVATAHQFGPVGYRDPAGAISPDGRWIAYSEGRLLRVRPIAGGPTIELPPQDQQIRYLSWRPDSRAVLADGYGAGGGSAVYDLFARTRSPLTGEMRQAVWSPDGHSLAALANGPEGPELHIVGSTPDPYSTVRNQRLRSRPAFPTWTPDGGVACIVTDNGRSRVTIPCGGPTLRIEPDADVYGPLGFSPDGGTLYVGLANTAGTVDLWAAPVRGGPARQLTSFSRDSYGPSVTRDGRVVFKLQNYRTHVASVSADGGPTRALALFQSETPSWDPTGRWIGVTFGSWRRLSDDANYPDIAQDAGIIAADPETPASAVARIVHNSISEDQSLCWSPNAKWMAFHSHKDQSDDIWLRPADADAPPVRISFLGRGAETGWPRWSPDGRWIVFTGADRETRTTAAYLVGIDQTTGAVTRAAQRVDIRGIAGSVAHAEWIGSDRLLAINETGRGEDIIYTVARSGGDASVVHRFASEHHAPGLAISPDGRDVAFIAPAPDGFFQVFRMPITTGSIVQVTTDPSQKTQPAWSPDGSTIAFTVWSYDAQFWMVSPR